MVSSIDISPPASPTSSPQRRGIRQFDGEDGTGTPLSLDLSSLPPLIAPSPPSNTLLITNLNNPATFHPQTLEKIKQLLSDPAPLNSFAPLRVLRRIIISYPTIAAAIQTHQLLDGTNTTALQPGHTLSSSSSPGSYSPPDASPVLQREDRIRIYFGEPTPIAGDDEAVDRHLKAPSLGKLLFISPPPSPPCGWEIKEEDPPNKDTHASDLQRALAGLNGSSTSQEETSDQDPNTARVDGEVDHFGKPTAEGSRVGDLKGRRERSASTTMVYHPRDHGDREDLPAVMVEDTTGEEEGEGEGEDAGQVEGSKREASARMLTHTARPPVELMEE